MHFLISSWVSFDKFCFWLYIHFLLDIYAARESLDRGGVSIHSVLAYNISFSKCLYWFKIDTLSGSIWEFRLLCILFSTRYFCLFDYLVCTSGCEVLQCRCSSVFACRLMKLDALSYVNWLFEYLVLSKALSSLKKKGGKCLFRSSETKNWVALLNCLIELQIFLIIYVLDLRSC